MPPVPELTEDEGSELTEYSDYSVNVQHPFVSMSFTNTSTETVNGSVQSSESNPLGIDRNRDIANATAIARLSAGDGILHTLPVAGENATSSFVADEHVGLYKPRYIAGIPKVCQRIRSKVPEKAVSFSFDFLCNFFSGITWSPGLMFIPPHRTSILPNHAYWVVDPATDPHLPSAPCEHGAKLVPFLKAMPEDNPAWDFPEDFPSTSEDVPLFVKHRLLNVKGELQWRYIYYGHYSQTRWSDKLDHDTMKKCVPASVKEKWAQDLSVRGRGKEMDRTLRAHFFPSPEYEGPLPGHATRDGGSIDTDRFSEREDQVLPALRRHAARLRSWKLDADMRTRMITKDFILESFERVSDLYLL